MGKNQVKADIMCLMEVLIQRHPELRVGQIIENARYYFAPVGIDLFYMEDEMLLERLKLVEKEGF